MGLFPEKMSVRHEKSREQVVFIRSMSELGIRSRD